MAPKMDIQKTCVEKKLDYMITILGSIVNIMGGGKEGGGLFDSFNERKNYHFDDE